MIIGEQLSIQGTIEGDEDLVVRGRVEGTVRTSGAVTIDEEGWVVADITASIVTIAGAVRGNVVAAERIEITETGRMLGDAMAPTVNIMHGATFKGRVEMGDATALSLEPPPIERRAQPRELPERAPGRLLAGQGAPREREARKSRNVQEDRTRNEARDMRDVRETRYERPQHDESELRATRVARDERRRPESDFRKTRNPREEVDPEDLEEPQTIRRDRETQTVRQDRETQTLRQDRETQTLRQDRELDEDLTIRQDRTWVAPPSGFARRAEVPRGPAQPAHPPQNAAQRRAAPTHGVHNDPPPPPRGSGPRTLPPLAQPTRGPLRRRP